MRKAFLFVPVVALALAACAAAPPAEPPPAPAAPAAPLAVVGHSSVLEFGPVLLASTTVPPGTVVTASGGVPNLWNATDSQLSGGVSGRAASGSAPVTSGIADLAGNAGTQTLRMSLEHPDVRVVMTVTEGLYRIVARKSAGIGSVADLAGKRVATFANTSAAVFLNDVLTSAGLSDADVTISSLTAPAGADALINGEVDAISIWEPDAERAAQALGEDAVSFRPDDSYREIYSLNAKEGDLADPAKRARIVEFLRAVTDGCRAAEEDPARMQELLAERTGQDRTLIADSWHHHRFPCALPDDLLDVLVAEEQWLADKDGRTPRGRDELAGLIDPSVLEEVRAQ
ncbi:ABC transporter substrate-binding protein [Pseudonocardia zijingensis]|jgi:NitT/TauT family transport system substrate-binding protein|uniref:ABC transporter substrate-binding protein n=1 Tax=Pseudonocardia zijingensis TaxID=153376 RepID=A0ABN1PF20_9PSEU